MGVQVAPRIPLELAAELLEITESEVRELIASRRVCETWVVTDGKRELMVRVDDMIRMLGRNAAAKQVQAR
jgi:hypothetical protein